jgi:anaerobic magnesium-protoporphyrin IX monomethyl ester cyclase
MSKRILFINPPFKRFKGILEMYFPLGLGYLASHVKERGYEPFIYNAEIPARGECRENPTFLEQISRTSMHDRYVDRVKDRNDPIWKEMSDVIRRYKPDFVGIAGKTVTYKIALEIARLVKEIDKNIPVILGGPHPTICPEDILADANVDFAVRGEGEETISALLEYLRGGGRGGDIGRIDGLSHRGANGIINNRMRAPITDLDALAFPLRECLINIHNHPPIIFNSMINDLIGSRGCCFNCTFCSVRTMWGRKIRFRSVDNVIAEIVHMKKEFGTTEFHLWDDSFSINKDYMRQFCETMIRRKISVLWSCSTRIDLLDQPLIQLMKKAGCMTMFVGIESGSERILKYIKKDISLGQVRQTAQLLKKAGMPWKAYFIIGFPEETEEDIRETFTFMQSIRPNRLYLTVFTPYPGTELFNEVKALGMLKEDIDWSVIESRSPYNAFVRRIPKDKFKELAFDICAYVDRYNNKSESFVKKILLRTAYYFRHPVLFVLRVAKYGEKRLFLCKK